jgi:purine-cytosine permease-like protein
MFSVGSGWTSIAADYNVLLPHKTPAWATWVASFIGMYLPICFTCTLSATLLTLTKQSYVDAFEENSLGGIVGEILIAGSGGFGKFLLALLAISTISANTPNLYSGALSLQSLHPALMKIPRVFFVFIVRLAFSVSSFLVPLPPSSSFLALLTPILTFIHFHRCSSSSS